MTLTLNRGDNADDFEIIVVNSEGGHMRMQMPLIALAGLNMHINQLIEYTLG